MSEQQRVCTINPLKGEISLDGKVVILRPKTFDLLLQLASKPNEIVAKSDILRQVWADSVVEDQVIFQSINEIRKELGDSELIKTHPRRGYSWTLENTVIQSQERPSLTKNQQTTFAQSRIFVFVAVFVVVILAASYRFFGDGDTATSANDFANEQSQHHKGLLILPVTVDALDASQKWLRFAAMQSLIDKLTPTKNVTVFKFEDSIEILSRLSLEERPNIQPLFEKSGASHILATSISGVPGDYHIIYTLHEPNANTTKTLHGKEIADLLNQLAGIYEDLSISTTSSTDPSLNTAFQDELITKAVQYLEINDPLSAYAFLQSAITNEPNNVFSQYLFATVAMRLGKADAALASIETAMRSPETDKVAQYQNRLTYLKGGVQLIKGESIKAKALFQRAQQLSKQHKDWLYYSYSQSMLGKVALQFNQLEQAKQYFDSAMQYQEILQCPLGVVQSHIDLAEFYLVKGDQKNSEQSVNAAQKLIEKQNLTLAIPVLENIKKRIESRNDSKDSL